MFFVVGRWRRRALVFGLALGGFIMPLLSAHRAAGAADAPGGSVEVTADFARPASARSMVGFLASMDRHVPEADRIVDLKPRLWRHEDPDLAERRGLQDTLFAIGPGDFWGYRSGSRTLGRPRDDWALFARRVERVVEPQRRARVAWAVWNEPDLNVFWPDTRERFFQTYLQAYRAIRRVVGPDRWVGGPEISRFDLDYLTRFLDFCVENACEVNYLSYHEIVPLAQLPRIADHLRAARQLIGDPRYAKLRIREIHVGEVLNEHDHLRPGALLGAFYYLEQGGADRAAKACWDEENGESSCNNASLNGLLDPVERRPRPAWWAVRDYAQGLENRVAASTTSASVVAFATRKHGKTSHPQILLGNFGAAGRSRVVCNRLSDVLPGDSVAVTATVFPDSRRPMAKPTRQLLGRMTVKQLETSGLTIQVPQGGAVAIDLSPEPAR